MNQIKAIDRKNYIIGLWEDILIFLFIPLLLLLILKIANIHPQFNPTAINSPLYFFLFILLFDMTHIFATIAPVKSHILSKKIGLPKILLLLAAIICLSLGIYTIGREYFLAFVALNAIFHICSQQYGWLSYCRWANAEKDLYYVDKIAIWCFMLIPVVYWLSSLTNMRDFYFIDGDLYFFLINLPFPQEVLQWLYWIIFLCYILISGLQIRKNRKFPLNKFLVISNTFIWFYLPIMFFNYNILFWTILYFSHPIIYMLFCRKNFRSLGRNFFVSFFFLFFLAVLWAVLWYFISHKHPNSYLEILIFVPLLMHYSIDSFIWKGSFLKNKQASNLE